MMSTSTLHQSRISKVHLPSETSYQALMPRSNSRYKSTIHVVPSSQDHQSANWNRSRYAHPAIQHSAASSSDSVPYSRSQRTQPQSGSNYSDSSIPLSSRSTTSSSSNTRRSPLLYPEPSTYPYSSLLPLDHYSSSHNPFAIDSVENLTRDVAVYKKRNPMASNTLAIKPSSTKSNAVCNQSHVPPAPPANHSADKHSHHSSFPTAPSDSSSDITILHHLPDYNETTDKSHQSLHDERVHRSPRKGNHHALGSRLHSTSLIDEHKKVSVPSLQYTIEPIHVPEDFLDDNQFDSKQKLIREEIKRKANENEQVLINVDEYAPEILIYLKQRENLSRPKSFYMRKQTELTWDMRAILIDWLSEVADEYKLYSETLHLAVNFIDRFLSRMSVTKSKFQLIGTTALYLAAKCEEVYPPNAAEFAYVTDNAYTKKQVLKIEDLLLQTLNFEVSTVTTHTFLLHYLKLAEVDEVTEDLARYIAELTLLDPECLQHLSSIQAAATLCLALHMCHKPPWSNKLKQTTGYTIQSFYQIMEKIFWLVAKANTHDKWAITKKYRHVKHHCVASIELPTSLPYIDMAHGAVR